MDEDASKPYSGNNSYPQNAVQITHQPLMTNSSDFDSSENDGEVSDNTDSGFCDSNFSLDTAGLSFSTPDQCNQTIINSTPTKKVSKNLQKISLKNQLKGVLKAERLIDQLKSSFLCDLDDSDLEENSFQIKSSSSFSNISINNFKLINESESLMNKQDNNMLNKKPDEKKSRKGTLKQIRRISRTDYGKKSIRQAYLLLESKILVENLENLKIECDNAFNRLVYHKLCELCIMKCMTMKNSLAPILDINKTSMTISPPQQFFEIIKSS